MSSAHKQHKVSYASFVCTLPFIAVSNSFSRCLDHCFRSFQSITKHWSTGAKLFCINVLSAAFFGIRESPSKHLRISLPYRHVSFFSNDNIHNGLNFQNDNIEWVKLEIALSNLHCCPTTFGHDCSLPTSFIIVFYV